MRTYRANVLILVEADNWAEACDALSGALSETLKYDGAILNWEYTRDAAGNFTSPHRVLAAEPFDDDDLLADMPTAPEDDASPDLVQGA